MPSQPVCCAFFLRPIVMVKPLCVCQVLRENFIVMAMCGLPFVIQIILICALMAAVPCAAAEGIIPVTVSAPERRTVHYTTGVVSAVSCADPTQGRRSELSVLTDTGRLDTLLVKATTTIYDAAGTAVPLDAVRNQKVRVRYIISTEGVHEALSIRILK